MLSIQPIVSVIIPVYNGERYIDECLKSIISQTYTSLEIICVNDGSKDNSQAVLEKYAQKDHRIIIVNQDNAGVSAARNKGIDIAEGEYITFLDCDDALDTHCIETLVSIIQREKAEIAISGYRRIYENGIEKNVTGSGRYEIQSRYEACKCLLDGSLYMGGACGKLYQRSMIENIRFETGIRYNEDVLFNAYTFLKAKRIIFYDIPIYLYYERQNSATSSGSRYIKARDCAKVASKLVELFDSSEAIRDAQIRYFDTLVRVYRSALLDRNIVHRDEQITIRSELEKLYNKLGGVNIRRYINYFSLTRIPHTYIFFYKLYDIIRKPNWDIKYNKRG